MKAPKKFHKKNAKIPAWNVRAVAALCLCKMRTEGQSLSALLPEYQSKILAKDAPLLQALTFGVARVLPRLQKILAQLLDKPLKNKYAVVEDLLLVGLYQLLYMCIPPFAAVDEVVNATAVLKVEKMRGLVNAVLRRFLREQENILAIADKHWHTMHPDWFINLLKPVYPNWRDILAANNDQPPMWLRVNFNQDRETYAETLRLTGIDSVQGNAPQALRLTTPCNVQKLADFATGAATVQDLHAQWAAILLEPHNGERILDACAAPGGKTTHILEMAPQADVVALDIEENRLHRVQENLDRLGQKAKIICADASAPAAWQDPQAGKFDKILLDAPCSATGVIRRHPDIKWLRQPEDIPQLVMLQGKILNALWGELKAGGTLVYATCSVLPQENSEQIRQFLATHPDATLCELPFEQAENAIGKQFLPTIDGGDGFYYAKLKKAEK